MKILVADDNKLIRAILCRLLADFGVVDTAKTGEDAVESYGESLKPGQEPYSLICMDMSLGEGMTGDVAIAEMRELEAKAAAAGAKHRAKILMVTAFADRENVLKTKDCCDGYILKPIVRERLFERLESFGFFAKLDSANGQNQKTPEDVVPLIPPSVDAIALEFQADFSAWDSAPILSLREDAILALVPKKVEEGAAPAFETLAPDKVKFFESVRPFALAARVDSARMPLRCGEGMAYLPERKAFIARRGGRAVLNKDGVFDIDPFLEIEGGLRYRNVDFAGTLIVKGDVADGISVVADEGVQIDGDAGSCLVKSGGDVSIRRFNGQNSGKIVSGGTVRLDYVYNSSVKAQGDILVSKESVNCELKSMGAIKGGAILGGVCSAFMGLELQKAGSPMELQTLLRAGFSFNDEEKIDALKAKLDRIDAEIAQLSQMLGPHASDFAKAMKLPEPQQARIFEMAGRRILLKYDERPDAEAAVAQARDAAGRFPAAKITVGELLCKGSTIEIGDKRESFPHDNFGPMTITTISDDARYFLERV